VFSLHTWIAVKPTGAPRYTRYEVLGFGVTNGAAAVRIDRMGPDNYWFGARPCSAGPAGPRRGAGQVWPAPSATRPADQVEDVAVAKTQRDRWFADSPLEGSGFELVWGFSCQVVVLV
jgi:hypothetical protein